MRILISYQYFSPAFKAGGPIQSINNIVSSPSLKNASFFVLCSDTDLGGEQLKVESGRWIQYNANTKVYYADERTLNDNKVHSLLNEIQPDVLFINGIFSKQFTIAPIRWKGRGTKILSVRGMLHPGALSQKNLKKRIYLNLFKLIGAHKKVAFHATTEEEAAYVRNVFGSDSKVWVVPNLPRNISVTQNLVKETGKLKLISIALISPMKNIKLVFEALQKCTSQIVYHLYGPIKDETYWSECKELMTKMPSNIRIEYKGAIAPENIEVVLEQYHCLIQPSKSENFGHSIYEALAAGKPVITSNFTPWNNLEENKAGFNTDVDGADGLRKSIENLAGFDNEKYADWSKAATQYAAKSINEEEIIRSYKAMFGIV
ncbi:MAG: glycosyltransferase [Bacteroidetes bacterium]|nr:glycosyltransferase [Bacteroidota bacterium]